MEKKKKKKGTCVHLPSQSCLGTSNFLALSYSQAPCCLTPQNL